MGSEAVNPPILGQQKAAFLHHNLRRPLRVHPEPSRVEGDDGAHRLAGRVERVNFLEPCVRHVTSHLQ